LDYSVEATRYGQQRYTCDGVEYIAGDAEKLPLGDGTVDVVVSFETIEHLHAPVAFVNEVRRVLRPFGLFVVSTPNREVFIKGNPYHLHEFTFAELDGLLRESFKNVKPFVQDDWISSAVLTLEDVEKQDGNLVDKIHTYKTMSRPARQTLFMLSICTDGTMPNVDQQVAMTGIYEMKGFVEELARKEDQIARLAQLRKELETKDRHIGDFQQMVAEKDGHLTNMRAMIAERDRAIEELKVAARRWEDELSRIRNSLWRRLFAGPGAVIARLRDWKSARRWF
jgi:SAM-dependent methyltransferase